MASEPKQPGWVDIFSNYLILSTCKDGELSPLEVSRVQTYGSKIAGAGFQVLAPKQEPHGTQKGKACSRRKPPLGASKRSRRPPSTPSRAATLRSLEGVGLSTQLEAESGPWSGDQPSRSATWIGTHAQCGAHTHTRKQHDGSSSGAES